ncbi:MAG: phenylalanine--tRNA ligase beta subunit-related protein [Bacteroides sp.]|nr:phenylalanine--tRNA ligase beta subunit-related protein [Bacteroides sp.]MCM1413932.1 phenylalanine--tRNA ligase beta subunit-related protein [Bacteroides sp.]MCM1471641.1 phenylalanine--tRNA ligase beta subunit-related protein [Bacteroides sp.]
MTLTIDQIFSEVVDGYRALIIETDVVNSPTPDDQKSAMDNLASEIASAYKIEQINTIPSIAATRRAYKACGKDPNRYRPSQEQMMRRIVRGLGLYNVNAVVDAGNELSLKAGCSVGCFDADKVVGDHLTLGIGREGEPYEGIGRGPLNIAGLPVFRDSFGGIGTPTSDNERTKISLDTRRLLMTIHLFDSNIDAAEVVTLAQSIFSRWCSARNFRWTLYQ